MTKKIDLLKKTSKTQDQKPYIKPKIKVEKFSKDFYMEFT